TLMDDELRFEHDLYHNYIKEGTADNDLIEKSEIINFNCSTTDALTGQTFFSTDEPITFYWNTKGGNKVYLKPFGEVGHSGSKTVKIKDLYQNIKVQLYVESQHEHMSVSQTIVLKQTKKDSTSIEPDTKSNLLLNVVGVLIIILGYLWLLLMILYTLKPMIETVPFFTSLYDWLGM